MPTKGLLLRTEIYVKLNSTLIITGLVYGGDPNEDSIDITT